MGPVDYSIECAGDGFNLQAMDGLTGSELRLLKRPSVAVPDSTGPVSYTHLRAHETVLDLVCRLLLEKKKQTNTQHTTNLRS